MGVAENIRRLRKLNGMTQEEFGRIADVGTNAVSQWETGRAVPRMGAVDRIAEHFGITRGEIVDDFSEQRSISGAPTIAIPLVATSHMGEVADDEEPDLTVRVPQEVVDRHPGCFAVRAEGGCMDKRYPSGSVLVVDPSMEPRMGDAVMARFQDGRSVIRCYMPGSSVLMLSPDSWSGTYDDIIIRQDDEPVTLGGVVVWYMAESDIIR